MKVLSLCDGVGTGYLVLSQLGIDIEEYHAFEINPRAIAVANYHFPQIIQHGNLIGADFSQFKGFDLVIGGLVCKSLSRARIEDKKVNNGLEGKSGIIFELQRALKEIQPKYFFSENVIPSDKSDLEKINKLMGCKGMLIDSADFSAQSRERYYWTNICDENQIVRDFSKVIIPFEDIMEQNVPEKYFYNKPFSTPDMTKRVCSILEVNTMEMNKRVYNPKWKMATLTCINGGYQEKKVLDNRRVRKLTELEYERCQGFPDNYTNVTYNGKPLSYTTRCSLMGDAWTVPVVTEFFRHLKDNK